MAGTILKSHPPWNEEESSAEKDRPDPELNAGDTSAAPIGVKAIAAAEWTDDSSTCKWITDCELYL